MVTIASVGFDPHRHQVLNVHYRLQVQGDQPWLREWLTWLESGSAGDIFCAAQDARTPPRIVH